MGNAAEYAAGIYNISSTATIDYCRFKNNTAASYGGAIANSQSTTNITNCYFNANQANSAGGGGIINFLSSVFLTKSSFEENSTNSNGGAIYNYDSATTISDCYLSLNTAQEGGGVYNARSNSSIERCTFFKNSANSMGGAIQNNGSSPTVVNCTISSCIATDFGGAIGNTTSSPTIMNCTRSGNNAGIGGGIYSEGSSNPIITNTILWGNSAPLSPEIHGGTPTVSYCIVAGGYPGTDVINEDPFLGELRNNGSPNVFRAKAVLTMAIDPSSPAFDAGNYSSAPITDARGYKRDSIPDIGAYEVGGLIPYPVTFKCDKNGLLKGTVTQTVFCGESSSAVEAVPNSGYMFVKWILLDVHPAGVPNGGHVAPFRSAGALTGYTSDRSSGEHQNPLTITNVNCQKEAKAIFQPIPPKDDDKLIEKLVPGANCSLGGANPFSLLPLLMAICGLPNEQSINTSFFTGMR